MNLHTSVRVSLALAAGLLLAAGAQAERTFPVLSPNPAGATATSPIERCLAFDLRSRRGTGLVYQAASATAVPAGRYRLHVPLALHPLGDPVISCISVELGTDGTKRSIGVLDFARAGEFTDFTLDLIVPDKTRPVLTLTIGGIREPRTADIPPKGPSADLDPGAKDTDINELDRELDGPDKSKDGTIPVSEMNKLPYALAVGPVTLEPLCPVMVTGLDTDKIRYRPGEKGKVTATLNNTGGKPVKAKVAIDLLSGLDTQRNLETREINLPPSGQAPWRGEFDTTGLHWGACIQTTVTVADAPPDICRSVFVVSTNIYECGILAAAPGQTGIFDNLEDARAAARLLKSRGFTGLEAFFWGACDMFEFATASEIWFSGQTGYAGSRAGTSNLLAACHELGIVSTFYANLWGGSGPPAIELMRRKPEWFGGAGFNTAVLADWALTQSRRVQAGNFNYSMTWILSKPPDDVFRYHANEILASIKTFGWDGIRYDSYYTDYWNVRAIHLVRDIVNTTQPEFAFGYNSFPANDYAGGAMDIMARGGGMFMLEYCLDYCRGAEGSLDKYAGELATIRDLIWDFGGHSGPIYAAPTPCGKSPTDSTAIDAIYACCALLAAGAHPYYNRMDSELADFPGFALRYGEFIWNNRMRPLKEPEKVVAFGNNTQPFNWPRYVRTLNGDNNRRRLVIHVLNMPTNYPFLQNLDRVTVPPLRDLPVTVTLPADAQVTGAWDLTPFPEPRQRKLAVRTSGGQVSLTLPDVRFYDVLVVDYTSAHPLESPLSRRALTASFLQDWMMVGPFCGNTNAAEYAVAYPPEKGVDLKASYPDASGATLIWKPYRRPGEPVQGPYLVDLGRRLTDTNLVVGYAYTRITSDRDREAVLHLAVDDAATVWVNGAQVLDTPRQPNRLLLDQFKAAIKLKKGANDILIKVFQFDMSWGFYLRLAEPDGRPLTEGMTFGEQGAP